MHRPFMKLILLGCLLASPLGAQVAFETEVLPILREHCFRCHGTSDVKGDLRLDGKDWILQGSGGGPVLEAGDAEESLLWSLTVLSKRDPDVMPAKGRLLNAKEADALKRWIDEGADFGSWKGSAGPSASGGKGHKTTPLTRPASLQAFDAMAKGRTPPTERTIERLAESGVRLTPVAAGHAMVRIELRAGLSKLDPAAFKALQDLQAQVVIADLAGAQPDADLWKWLAGCEQLVRLDLGRTPTQDKDLARLSKLRHLQRLNLYGTKVSDRGLAHLAKITPLRKVYLWSTAVTAEGVSGLQRSLPELKIVHVFNGPEAAEPEPENERRRRR